MIDREDVVGAYRHLLGREPENENVVLAHVRGSADLDALRARLLASPDFYRVNARDLLRHFSLWEANRTHGAIEVDCDEAALDRLFAHIRDVWSRLGEVEPHFSVFSAPNFKPENLLVNLAAFEGSGRSEVELLKAELKGLGLSSTWRQCVELGCGVGRVTRYLAAVAEHVTGFDISAPHLRLARTYLSREGVKNVMFYQVEEPARIDLPRCDLFYSRVVLQHNPPPIMRFLLRAALDALLPGGVAVFQLPTYIQGYAFRLEEYLAGMHKLDNQELHALPQRFVFQAIADSGCEVLSVYRDNSLPNIYQVSKRFVVQKR
ncbi:class I SAM-dependent methyltransferase [Leptolyngbya sp. 15MV]|nr:class I SAM-dependent methyltransferase [Leptolyngbya sp. 15MV]